MLIHGIGPESMLLGTMVPIPQNKRQSLCNSDNYRAITLSSIIGKIMDWIILIKEEQSLSSSSLQFGFKGGTSTTQSTFIRNETVSYYNFNHTNVYAVFLIYVYIHNTLIPVITIVMLLWITLPGHPTTSGL